MAKTVCFFLSLFIAIQSSAASGGSSPKTRAPAATQAFSEMAQEPWCHPLFWPFTRDLTLPMITSQIQGRPRLEILQYAWGEVLTSDNKHLVSPLFAYLGGTEQNQDLRGYYKLMAYLAQNEIPAEDAIRQWPKRVPILPVDQRLTLEQMCGYFQQAGGMPRAPSAVDGKITKSVKPKPSATPAKKK